MTRRTRFSFTVTILIAFALVFLAAVGAIIAGFRATAGKAALATAEDSLAQAAETAAASTRALIRPVVALAAVLPEFAPLADGTAPEARDTRALLALLAAEPAVQAISMGLADGTLRQVMRAEGLAGQAAPPVPEGAAFALRDSEGPAEDGPGARERWVFLDAALRPVGALLRAAPADADPRRQQWYLQADDGAVHVSTLYDLPLIGRPGLSFSRRAPAGGAVLALDMTLDGLAAFLGRQRASPRSVLFLFTEDGIMLAHERPELAVLPAGPGRTSWTTLDASRDPLLRRVWEDHAQGLLPPGVTRTIAGPEGPLLVRLARVEDLAAPRILVAVAAPHADFTGPVEAAVREGTTIAGLALLAGLLGTGIVAWRMARPLGALTREAEAIRRLELTGGVPVDSRITEVARLSEAMDGMKSALRQFGVYVPRALVGQLMAQGGAARIGGTRRRVTIMFSDVDGFTTLAEGMDPEALMRVTSEYFQALTEELMRNRATIDKYIGDAVMAIWNAPSDDASHAWHACRAALLSRVLTDRLCERFAERGWPRLRTRFGLHTGDAVLGNLGSTDRMAYTAIGAMVNLASRLEGMNKFYGTRILVSEATRAAAGAGFVTRPVDLVLAKGARMPVEVHELLGLSVVDGPGEAMLLADAHAVLRLPAWQRMVAHYRAGRFDAAAAALSEAGCAADPLHALYAERIAALRGAPPPPEWSPVLRFTTK